MAQDYPSQKLDQFLLRLPDGMRDQIAAAARSNNRTMTAEIVWRLQASLDGKKGILVPKGTRVSAKAMAEIMEGIVRRAESSALAKEEGRKTDTSPGTEFEKRIGEQLEKGLEKIAQQIGRLEKRLERLEGLHSPPAAPKAETRGSG
jgi:hypothetical protein